MYGLSRWLKIAALLALMMCLAVRSDVQMAQALWLMVM